MEGLVSIACILSLFVGEKPMMLRTFSRSERSGNHYPGPSQEEWTSCFTTPREAPGQVPPYILNALIEAVKLLIL